MTGQRRHRAGLDTPLTRRPKDLGDLLEAGSGSVLDSPPADRRAAAVTAADHAVAGGWVSELGEVLDALGLR